MSQDPTQDNDEVLSQLREWKLDSYYEAMMDAGFDTIDTWDTLEESDLIEMGMKKGHARKFLKKYLQNFTLSSNINTISTDNSAFDDEKEDDPQICIKHQPQNNAKQVSIVFLGETGVGKTTLLYSLRDYINKVPFENIHMTPRVKGQKEGQSQTQKPYDDVVKNDKWNLTIIDTPGIGDTQGIAKDQQHINNICSFLGRNIEFNAIAIVMPNGVNRATPKLSYIINEIKTNLPKNAKDNFVVILTRSDSVLPGKDTIAVIKQFDLPLKNVFMVDNKAYEVPYFDDSLSQEDKAILAEAHKEGAKLAYEATQRKLEQILTKICNFKLYQGSDIGELRNQRRLLQEKVVQCRERIDFGDQRKKYLKQVQENITTCQRDIKKTGKFTINVQSESLEYVDKLNDDGTKMHRTVCTVCGSHVGCHNPCYLKFGSDIRLCASIVNEKCTSCGHKYENHCHSLKWPEKKIVSETKIDYDIKNKHESLQRQKAKLNGELQKLRAELVQIEEDRKNRIRDIQEAYAEIERIAILGYNDSYEAYINTCIEAVNKDTKLPESEKREKIASYSVAIQQFKTFVGSVGSAIKKVKFW